MRGEEGLSQRRPCTPDGGRRPHWLGLALVLVVGLCLAATAAYGQMDLSGTTIVVDTVVDDTLVNGNCTLREAVIAANTDAAVDGCPAGAGRDTILLPPGTYLLTIPTPGEDTPATGDLDVSDDLVLQRHAAGDTVVDGNGLDRVVQIGPSVRATIDGLTIQGGDSGSEEGGGIHNSGTLTLTHSTVADNSAFYGSGGIRNEAGGHLTILDSTLRDNDVTEPSAGGCMGGGICNMGTLLLERSTLTGNSAYVGGAILNQGVLTATNVTVSGNTAAFTGGIESYGPASLIHVTIADNFSTAEGSGLYGHASLWNSIVAYNTGGNCAGTFTSGGHNLDSGDSCGFDAPGDLVNTDPLLGALQNNGGATRTHALLAGSPAIDAAGADACPATDQRGVPRPADGDGDGVAVCDIGAFEVGEVPEPNPPIVVSTTEDELLDDGDCSLREAVQAANTDAAVDACPAGGEVDLILVPGGVYTLTLPGWGEDGNATGDLDIQASMTIQGAGAPQTRIVGGAADRLLHISPTVTVEIQGMTLANGRAPGGTYGVDGEDGGGIRNAGTLILNRCGVEHNAAGNGSPAGRYDPGSNGGHGGGLYNTGTLILNHSTVSGNAGGGALSGPYGGGGSGGDGGGIYNAGTLQLYNATVSGNRAGNGAPDFFFGGSGGGGGGVWNTGTVWMDNTTLADNAAGAGAGGGSDGQGGGIYHAAGEVHLKNSILARNRAVGGPSDCEGTALVSHGYNLVEDAALCALTGDPTGNLQGVAAKLSGLSGRGGRTQTHALRLSSPALDAASCTDMGFRLVTSDQRDVPRPQGAGCDMGAFERELTVYVSVALRGHAEP